MIRSCGITLSLFGLAFVVVSAQDPSKEPEPILKKKVKKSDEPGKDKNDEPELKKSTPKKNPDDEPELKKVDPKKKKDDEPELKKLDPVVPVLPNRESREELVARI